MALNATCVRCHEAQAREWQGSHHQRADVNPAYRAAFAIEPLSFCRRCHAPEADPRRPAPRAVSELGVGCVTCHVTGDGSVLAAPATDPGTDDSRAPHPLQRSERFGATGGCEGCHEFQFPAGRGDDDGQFMQTTLREHARSASADKGCASCHMPAKGRRRGHSFSEVRDPEWLRENLIVTVERGEDGALLVTLSQPAPGHGFPTGDLFRRLEIGADLLGPDNESLGRDARHLLRRFEHVPGLAGRQLTLDNRVFDEPVTLELTPDRGEEVPEGATIAWWVSLQRVATVGAGADPAVARIESEVKLYSGTVPW